VTVTKRTSAQADLGAVAEAGIHLPEPTNVVDLRNSHPHDHDHHHEHGHGHDHEGHGHGAELVDVLRVVFVALAAAAVWFHLWEPFHRVSVIGLAATLIGGYWRDRGGPRARSRPEQELSRSSEHRAPPELPAPANRQGEQTS